MSSESKHTENSSVKKALEEVLHNFKSVKWETFWDVFTLKLLFEVCMLSFYTTLSMVLINNYNSTQLTVGYIFALHAVLIVVCGLMMPRIESKYYKNDKTGLLQGFHASIILLAALIGFYLSPNFYIFAVFIFPLSLVRIMLESTSTRALLSRTSEDEKGVVMGAYESVMPLAGFIAPLMVGLSEYIWGASVLQKVCIPPTVGLVVLCKLIQLKMDRSSGARVKNE